MSCKVLCFIFAAFLVFHASNSSKINISPYTLYDQAVLRLEQLQEIVDSSILTAQVHLDSKRVLHEDYVYQERSKTTVELENEANRFQDSIDMMVELAGTIDVSSCLVSVPELQNLLQDVESGLDTCITNVANRLDEVLQYAYTTILGAQYYVSKVEDQLHACTTGSIICLTPVVTQIDAYKIELPELIDTTAQSNGQLIDSLTSEIDRCTSSSISDYVNHGQEIVDRIEVCIDSLV